MILPGKNINSFKVGSSEAAGKGSWFTGKMNTQILDFDPFVSGYAFIIWVKIPAWVTDAYPNFRQMTQKNFKTFQGISDLELQTAQYTHTFNANAYEYATTLNKGNTNFSISHQEFSGSPIKNMYQFWVSGIRDPETDIATYARAYNTSYGAKNHTGELLYIVTRPDANNYEHNNIEFSAYYTAVFPTRIPLNHLNYSQGSHDSPDIEINFVGDLHIGPAVDEFAYSVMCGKNTTSGIVKPYSFVTSAYFDPNTPTLGDNLTLESKLNNDIYKDYSPKNKTISGKSPVDAYTSGSTKQAENEDTEYSQLEGRVQNLENQVAAATGAGNI